MTKQLFPLRRLLAVSVTAGLLLASTVVTPASAEDAPPSGFPSWSDVEKAKGDAAATAAQVAKISSLLDSLEAEAGTLGDAAVKAGGELATTQAKLDAVTQDVNVLSAQSQRAAAEAAEYQKAAVAIAVQSYKNGGTGLGVFSTLSALESPESLNGVEMLNQVGERAALKQRQALESKATAESLEKTRQAAVTAQAELTGQAQSARTAAVAAQDAVTSRLAEQKAQSTTLVEQLASLNNTSVATELEYRKGQEAQAAYEQVQAAKRQAAADAAARAAADAAQRAADQAAQAAQQPKPVAPAPQPVVPNPAPAPAPAPDRSFRRLSHRWHPARVARWIPGCPAEPSTTLPVPRPMPRPGSVPMAGAKANSNA
ncbi:hypothetical protein [Arthrobacter psychrolactophilus]